MKFQFEKSLEKLKEIVQKLENEDVDLESSLSFYSEGIKLYHQCNDFLEKSSRKIEILKNGQELVLDEEVKSESSKDNSKEKKQPNISLFEDVEKD